MYYPKSRPYLELQLAEDRNYLKIVSTPADGEDGEETELGRKVTRLSRERERLISEFLEKMDAIELEWNTPLR